MISNVLIFLVNFCMSVIYCQLIESSSFEIIFIIPCIMQLVILFYCARLIGLQLRIMAMDKFSDIKSQQDWLSWTQIKIYIAAIFAIYNVNLIFFNKWCIFTLFGSLWVTQLYRNTVLGLRNIPSWNFALTMTLHCLSLPIYFTCYDGNVLSIKPSNRFVYIVTLWVMFQLFILKIQQKKPRILLPKFLRPHVIKDYYQYERYFETEADKKSWGSNFFSKDQEQEDDYEPAGNIILGFHHNRDFKKHRRVEKLKHIDCCICLQPVGLDINGAARHMSPEELSTLDLESQVMSRYKL